MTLPPEMQDWLELLRDLPFYVRFGSIALVVFMVLVLVALVVITLELHSIAGAIKAAAPRTNVSLAAAPWSQAGQAGTQAGWPGASTAAPPSSGVHYGDLRPRQYP